MGTIRLIKPTLKDSPHQMTCKDYITIDCEIPSMNEKYMY